MMKQTLIAAAVASLCLLSAAPVLADDAAPAAAADAAPAAAADAAPASPLSFNVGVVSDYIFRGISQTHGDPAIQGGIDYAFPSGFYVGTWASSISWVKDYTNKGDVELDIYGGYRGSLPFADWSYDVGAIGYIYPGHGPGNTLSHMFEQLFPQMQVGGAGRQGHQLAVLAPRYSLAVQVIHMTAQQPRGGERGLVLPLPVADVEGHAEQAGVAFTLQRFEQADELRQRTWFREC